MDYAKELDKVVNILASICADVKEAETIVLYEQGVMQDISHKLELYQTTDTERQKLATIYANSARKRRKSKKTQETLDHVNGFICSLKLIDKFKQRIKEIEKEQEKQESRQYTPRSEKIRFDETKKYCDKKSCIKND